jgi:site-specific recombinase XerD
LRHSCASWLVDAGVSLYVVQNILGHSNISTTQIYSHLSQNTLHESMNRVSLCA